MRKKIMLTSIIGVILVISVTTAFSRQGWRGGDPGICLRKGDSGELATLEGKITGAERPEITMDVDGGEYILHAGPRWYWQEKGYAVEEGQDARITGVVEEVEGALHVYPKTIEVDGESIELIDENGSPVWAGRRGGRGPRPAHGYGGRGRGRGYGARGYGRGHGGAQRGFRYRGW